MGLAEHEIPESQQQGNELAPQDITPVNRPLYMLVIAGLLIALLFGIVAWFVLVIRGQEMPEGLAVLIGTIGGGLVGLLTASKS